MKPPDESTAPLTDPGETAGGSAPGSTVGRFVVEGTLGAGGMGVVLAAFDPALSRKVALKLLRPGGGARGEVGRELLRREAQAMAQLAHPNVATVYEVGSVGEQLFVAMELVEGQTLSGWLRQAPRDWRAVVAMFVAAGRGLEHAHAAGLVHRDFKPDNVLVGREGRPRVTDFGLVSLRAAEPSLAVQSPVQTLSQAGTVAYMAPEQLRGEPSDARSDQFAFCVALHHALYGERPFAADAPPEARSAPPRPPPGRRVPARLYPVIARGLAAAPEQRWPSMSALLKELSREPQRRWLWAAGVALLLLGAGLALVRARAAICRSATPRLAGVWDDQVRLNLRAAFFASQQAGAEDAFARVVAGLDRYASEWVAMHEETCRATHIERRQSDTLMDLRFACLERRRSALSALTQLWSKGMDGLAVRKSIDAVAGLPSLSECADGKALAEVVPMPRDPVKAAAIERVLARLDRSRALQNSGRLAEGEKEARAARVEADAIGWPEARARAAFLVGRILQGAVDPQAEPVLSEAASLAAEAHDDRLEATALVQLCQAISTASEQPDRALLVCRLAEGAIERAGGDPGLRSKLELARAHTVEAQGNYEAARVQAESAYDRLTAALGPNADYTIEALSMLQRLAWEHGDNKISRELAEEVLRREIETKGPNHDDTAIAWTNVAAAANVAGDFLAARDAYRKAMPILEETYGPESERVGMTLGNLANSENQLGQFDAAGQHYERAIAIGERLKPDDPETSGQRCNLSTLRAQQGRYPEAKGLAERCLAGMQKRLGLEHPLVAYAWDAVGEVAMAMGDYTAADEDFARGLRISEAKLGADVSAQLQLVRAEVLCRQKKYSEGVRGYHDAGLRLAKALGPDTGLVGRALGGEGRCLVDAGRAREALPILERALAVSKKGNEPAMALAAIAFTQARARFALGDRERALLAARAAERDLAAAPLTQYELALARRWLKKHDAADRSPPDR
jgi:tetratricopeptide (TPR) repeat protein